MCYAIILVDNDLQDLCVKMVSKMDFEKVTVKHDFIFDDFLPSIEPLGKGRSGAIIFSPQHDSTIPIVRSTTSFQNRSQPFLYSHNSIVAQLSPMQFNNALVEVYDDDYSVMKYHTDQSLDLQDDSYIALFSFYEYPGNGRILYIKNKITGLTRNIPLEHNSIVIFSTSVNQNHVHKIILEKRNKNRWMGITFRLSKTFVTFKNSIPYIDNVILSKADEEQRKDFCNQKSQENNNIDFKYSRIDYTLSDGDLVC